MVFRGWAGGTGDVVAGEVTEELPKICSRRSSVSVVAVSTGRGPLDEEPVAGESSIPIRSLGCTDPTGLFSLTNPGS